jgi:hypothetical protein
MALGKALLCRVLGSRQSTVLGKELTGYLPLVFAKCYRLTLGKDFFVFGFQTFSVGFTHYFEVRVQIWHISRSFCYISLIYFIYLHYSKNGSLNCRCIESWNLTNGKMIFLILSVV